jgi:hypothetical protein
MRDTPPHLKPLEEIERECISGLVEVLHKEGLDAVRYVLWDATGHPKDYSPRQVHRATEEQQQRGWEMAVRIEKILCTVLHEAHTASVKTIDPGVIMGE